MISEQFSMDENFKTKALYWASSFDHYSFLNFNQLQIHYAGYPSFPSVLAAGSASTIEVNSNDAFNDLKKYIDTNTGYKFGYLSYDLKNEIEELSSKNEDHVQFPDLFFFAPLHLLQFSDTDVKITSSDPSAIYKQIVSTNIPDTSEESRFPIQQRISKEEYLHKVEIIKEHLIEGDIYELNFCMEFFAEQAEISAEKLFHSLSGQNPMPFSGILKNKDKFLISASPERFLKKEGQKLISQPMKGTSRRSSDPIEDNLLFNQLKECEKERSENMMIVDLVRNDLARSSNAGTTKVEEIFGVYSLSHVHQMISTVTSELRKEIHFIDAIKNAFPMGSMTGAPKISAMQLIEELEKSKRGVYSGAFGFFDPSNDFDFNVVIRSIVYNRSTQYLSFQAGSAITYDSIPEKEYEECQLKAEAINRVLEGK